MPTRVTPYLGGTGQDNTGKINVHATLKRVSIGADILGNANLVVYGNSYANVAEGAATRFANATIFNTANASINVFSSAANARFDMGATNATFSQILYSGTNASNIRFVAGGGVNNAFVEINEFTFMNNAYVRGNLFVAGSGSRTTLSPNGWASFGVSSAAYSFESVTNEPAKFTSFQNSNTHPGALSVLRLIANGGGNYTQFTAAGIYLQEAGTGTIVSRYTDYDTQYFRNAAGATILDTTSARMAANTKLAITSAVTAANLSVGGNAFVSGNVVSGDLIAARNQLLIGSISDTNPGSSANLVMYSASGAMMRLMRTGTAGDVNFQFAGVATGDGTDFYFSPGTTNPATGMGYAWQTTIGTGYGANTAMVINRFGNVAIGGTLNPMSNLHVNGNAFVSSNVFSGGVHKSYAGTAVAAGANTQAFVTASSVVNQLGIFYGTGAPTFGAGKGSIYTRTDGTTTITRLYVNTDGGTTWTTITTAA